MIFQARNGSACTGNASSFLIRDCMKMALFPGHVATSLPSPAHIHVRWNPYAGAGMADLDTRKVAADYYTEGAAGNQVAAGTGVGEDFPDGLG